MPPLWSDSVKDRSEKHNNNGRQKCCNMDHRRQERPYELKDLPHHGVLFEVFVPQRCMFVYIDSGKSYLSKVVRCVSQHCCGMQSQWTGLRGI